jgi:hypothetical protein
MVFEKRGIIGIVEVRVRRTKGLGEWEAYFRY